MNEEDKIRSEPTGKVIGEIARIEVLIASHRRLYMLLSVCSGFGMFVMYPNIHFVKNVLHRDAAVYTVFNSVAKSALLMKPFMGYLVDVSRFKMRFMVSACCLMCAGSCFLVFLFRSRLEYNFGVYLFGFFGFLVNFFFCWLEVFAQGLTVVVMRYEKTVKELELETESGDPLEEDHQGVRKITDNSLLSDGSRTSEIGSTGKSKVDSNKNFGYFTIVRNVVAILGIYLGGRICEILDLQFSYLILASIPLLLFLYTLIVFVEDKTHQEERQRESISSKFSKSLAIMKTKPLRTSLTILFLSFLSPTVSDPNIYILTDKRIGNWTFGTLANSSLLYGISYVFLMLFLVKKLKLIDHKFQMLASITLVSFQIMSYFSSLLSTDLPFVLLFSIQVASGVVGSIGRDFMIVPTIGKFTVNCTKGLENFGLTLIATLISLSFTLSGFLGGFLTKQMGVTSADYYQNYSYVLIAALCYNVTIILSLPCFDFL